MRIFVFKFLRVSLLIVGLVLLLLTNTGILSHDTPYIYELSNEMPAANPPVAFVNVNVIPMDSERILEDQTVIVRDGVIEEMGASTHLQIPSEAITVEGRGRYLILGLVERRWPLVLIGLAVFMISPGSFRPQNLAR